MLLENPRALCSGGEGKRYSTELWEPCFEDQCTHCAPWARVLSWAQGQCAQGHCHSEEPKAQLEEQVGKNEGGELGWGPAFLTKVYSVSQAGLSLPLRKA